MNSAVLAQLLVVAAGAVALGVIMRHLGRQLPRRGQSPFDAALVARVDPERPVVEFESIGRVLDGAQHSAFDVHYSLRPIVRELAVSRLRQRRGIELDRQPGLASEVLGSDAFALLREGRPAPRDYRRPAMTLQALERIVDALESI